MNLFPIKGLTLSDPNKGAPLIGKTVVTKYFSRRLLFWNKLEIMVRGGFGLILKLIIGLFDDY